MKQTIIIFIASVCCLLLFLLVPYFLMDNSRTDDCTSHMTKNCENSKEHDTDTIWPPDKNEAISVNF